MNHLVNLMLLSLMLCAPFHLARGDDEAGELIARIRAVGAEGAGSAAARAARDALAARGPDTLPYLLLGMDTPNTVAANWLRTAFDDIVERAFASDPRAIPSDELLRFLLDAKRQGRARRLALDVLTRLDPASPDRILPPLLDDPEFRHDAVAYAVAEGDRAATAQHPDDARAAYRRGFDAARDADQVTTTAAKLRAVGSPVSIRQHMGFLTAWHLIGPFDGPQFRAFANAYPPEREIDLDALYDGKGSKVGWKRYETPDEFGTVDLVKALAPADDAAAYAYTQIDVPRAMAAELRGGADDNLTIWVNGAKVFAKEEWQNGTRLDRFIVPIRLRKGANQILLKVCQGPAYVDPGMANLWSFQIRLCGHDGRGIPVEH